MTLSLPAIVRNHPYLIEDYHPLLHVQPIPGNLLNRSVNHEILPASTSSTSLQPISPEEEQRNFLADLLEFQTTCTHPGMKSIVTCMLQLKHDALQAKIEKAELEKLVSHHAESIFQDIAKELYEIIKSSPRLKKRLKEYWEKSDQIEIKELIQILENTENGPQKHKGIHEDWVWVEKNTEQATIILDTDLVGLDDLEQKVWQLERAGRASGNPQEFMIEISKLRRETRSGQPWGKTIYNAASMTWRGITAICYAVTAIQSAMPTVMIIAPFIVPVRWISLIQILIRVFRS